MKTDTMAEIVKCLEELDRLYELHLIAASYDNWKQHCEVWRMAAHKAASLLESQAALVKQEHKQTMTTTRAELKRLVIDALLAERDALKAAADSQPAPEPPPA